MLPKLRLRLRLLSNSGAALSASLPSDAFLPLRAVRALLLLVLLPYRGLEFPSCAAAAATAAVLQVGPASVLMLLLALLKLDPADLPMLMLQLLLVLLRRLALLLALLPGLLLVLSVLPGGGCEF
jgi:hypothetical protein